MPRARPVEVSRLLLSSQEREPPRLQAVASVFDALLVAGSSNREAPRDKPVASSLNNHREAPREKPVASGSSMRSSHCIAAFEGAE
jgi:hypothetical protein